MVFELLGQSVFDHLKSIQFKPFPQSQIQQLTKQLITSVACKFNMFIYRNHSKCLNNIYIV